MENNHWKPVEVNGKWYAGKYVKVRETKKKQLVLFIDFTEEPLDLFDEENATHWCNARNSIEGIF